ncbi:MAG: hypothetical protein H6573_08440 [Lewinellaceae bacterium]|nr:hypothetical protein [Lewinellaceae bacterium]
MGRKIIFFFIFLLAVALRLSLHFRQELIPGVNGGYYPLQVRSLLENGRLGFADMPLYFWFNAFWVKVLAVFSATPAESWIIPVVKTVDSLFLPLLLVPLYFIARELRPPDKPDLFRGAAVAVFAAASPWPLMFTGDLQKNAFAIPFFFAFLLFGLKYLRHPSRRWMLAGLISLGLAGLSHFGVFVVAALTLGLGLFFYAPRRALLPVAALAVLSTGVVALFDPSRAWRLLMVAAELFRGPALLSPLGPPELLGYLFSWLLLGLGGYVWYKHKAKLDAVERVALPTLLALIFFLSFPLIDADYARRFMLMLFVPQAVLCLLLFPRIPARAANALSVGLMAVCLAFSPGVLHFKQPVISQAAFNDLEGLNAQLQLNKNSLIIARHGLEWWAGWALHCKTGNEKGVDEETAGKYRQVLFLHQKKGQESSGPGAADNHPGFREPEPPFGEREEVVNSEFFQVYVWKYSPVR